MRILSISVLLLCTLFLKAQTAQIVNVGKTYDRIYCISSSGNEMAVADADTVFQIKLTGIATGQQVSKYYIGPGFTNNGLCLFSDTIYDINSTSVYKCDTTTKVITHIAGGPYAISIVRIFGNLFESEYGTGPSDGIYMNGVLKLRLVDCTYMATCGSYIYIITGTSGDSIYRVSPVTFAKTFVAKTPAGVRAITADNTMDSLYIATSAGIYKYDTAGNGGASIFSSTYVTGLSYNNGSLYLVYDSVNKFTVRVLTIGSPTGFYSPSCGTFNFEAYPCPAGDFVNIMTEGQYDAFIYDATGREVVHAKLIYGLNRVRLDNLNPGMYFLNVGGIVKKLLKL